MASQFKQREDFLSIEVDGPRSFSRALGKASKGIKRDYTKVVRGVAAEVRDNARARYRGRYRQRSGRSVTGITSSEGGGEARVRLVKSRPWLVGQEWGGYEARFHPYNMPVLRGGQSGVGGTYLWPAVVESRADVTEAMEEAVDGAIKTLRGRG